MKKMKMKMKMICSTSERTGEARQYHKSEAPRLIWSHQLHQQFVGAVETLGGKDKATPKNILQMMDVKGLKISHIKSHLQMFRNMKEKRHIRAMRKVTSNVNLLGNKFCSSRNGVCFGFIEGSSQSTQASDLNPDQVLSSNTCISSRTWNEEEEEDMNHETLDFCRLSLSAFSSSPALPTLMEMERSHQAHQPQAQAHQAHPCQSSEDYEAMESFRTTHINLDLRI